MENKLTPEPLNKEQLLSDMINGKKAVNNRKLTIELFISIFLLAAALILLANFLKYIELREGVILEDPVLELLNPSDLTWLTFILIYGCLLTAVISFAKNHIDIILALQAYALLIFIRMTAMYLTPLNPPKGMIPLQDPFVEFFGTGILLTKDLFFSGHTALLFLLFLIEKNRYLKYLFLGSAVIVGICLLIQHVHYSIDVFAAPFFSYTVLKVVLKIRSAF